MTLFSTQVPLAVLQAHLRASPSTAHVLPSSVVPAVTSASAATISGVSLPRTHFAKHGVENINTYGGLGPLSTPTFGSEVISVVEPAHRAMGGTFFYGPAAMTHAPVEPAQNVAHDKLPPTCSSPRPGIAALVPYARVAPF
ncbi:hypothetical protein FRC08_015636 [Ceratobasidium sp. 394]|nr:hypothetical protein FRC08_015636 [Ceratobasidium sp. 394]